MPSPVCVCVVCVCRACCVCVTHSLTLLLVHTRRPEERKRIEAAGGWVVDSRDLNMASLYCLNPELINEMVPLPPSSRCRVTSPLVAAFPQGLMRVSCVCVCVCVRSRVLCVLAAAAAAIDRSRFRRGWWSWWGS